MELKQNIIWGLMAFVIVLPFQLFVVYNTQYYSFLDLLGILLASVLVIYFIKKTLRTNPELSYLNSFKISGTIGVVVGVLSGLLNYYIVNTIHPNFIPNQIAKSKQYFEQINLAPEQIENYADAITQQLGSPFSHIANNTFTAVFIFGLITVITVKVLKPKKA